MSDQLYTMETAPVSSSVPAPTPENPKAKKPKALQPATFPKFIPTQEGFNAAVAYFSAGGPGGDKGGIGYVMDRLNTQIGTDARNEIRSAFAASLKGPNEAALLQKANNMILLDEGLRAQAIAHINEPDWVTVNLVRPILEKLRAEHAATVAASVPDQEADTEEEGAGQ